MLPKTDPIPTEPQRSLTLRAMFGWSCLAALGGWLGASIGMEIGSSWELPIVSFTLRTILGGLCGGGTIALICLVFTENRRLGWPLFLPTVLGTSVGIQANWRAFLAGLVASQITALLIAPASWAMLNLEQKASK